MMLCRPKLGQPVLIRYNPNMRGGELGTNLHGKEGIVKIVGNGKPLNHGVEIDGVLYVIPCGNLNKIEKEII